MPGEKNPCPVKWKVHLWLLPTYFNVFDSAHKQPDLQEVGGISKRNIVYESVGINMS